MDVKPFAFMILCVGVLISATYVRVAIVQSTVDKNHKELMELFYGNHTNAIPSETENTIKIIRL